MQRYIITELINIQAPQKNVLLLLTNISDTNLFCLPGQALLKSNQDIQNAFKKYNSTYLTVKCRTAIKVLFTLIKTKTKKIPHSHVKLVSLSCSFTSISFLTNTTGINFWDSNRLIHMRCWITFSFFITYDNMIVQQFKPSLTLYIKQRT